MNRKPGYNYYSESNIEWASMKNRTHTVLRKQFVIVCVTQYYTNTVPQVHWGKPDIWLGLVSCGSEAYPMLMGKGSSARYEEMKERGTSILKTFIIYSIFSYVQHGRIHHITFR